MKVIILAGGYGSRLGSITETIPKPMVEIGGKPIIWHIMNYYSYYGFTDFVLCLGYKAHVIKNYFLNYHFINNDFQVNMHTNDVKLINKKEDHNWKVTLVDTGVDNLKGSRIKQIEHLLEEGPHLLTYGDGLCDVDIQASLDFHNSHGKLVTITGVRPPSRFGELNVEGDRVISFEEKPQISTGLINGGFMVIDKKLVSHLDLDKNCDFEFVVLEKLATTGEVMVYKHTGNWECVDTERDLNHLNKIWGNNNAFWEKK